MSYSALSDSFEYLCYGSTAIRNVFTLTVRGSTLDVSIWRLQTSDSDDWSLSPRCKGKLAKLFNWNSHPLEIVSRWISWFLIIDNHVKNKKCGNFVSISSLTGKCAAQKLKKTFAVLVYGYFYIIWSYKEPKLYHWFFKDIRPGHFPLMHWLTIKYDIEIIQRQNN